jgi:hypothetical protein
MKRVPLFKGDIRFDLRQYRWVIYIQNPHGKY